MEGMGMSRDRRRQNAGPEHSAGARWRAPLLMAVFATTLALTANASALIVSVHGGRVSYLPTRQAAPTAQPQSRLLVAPLVSHPLEYHGGPVMTSNINYTLYWDPAGAPAYPAGYQAGLNTYFEDLAHDSGGQHSTDSVLTQYKDAAGEFADYDSHFGGALIDTHAYPANGCSAAAICLTDQQLRTEIAKYLQEHKLPTDLAHEYFLLTPPGVESCFEAAGRACSAGTTHSAFCAYHSFIAVSAAVIIYANNPYVDGLNCDFGEEHPNDNPSDATIAGGLSHEHSESVTDPELTAWSDSKGEEVADKCRTFKQATEYGEPLGKAPDGANYNQVINGHLYYYQQEWSNEASECVQRLAQPPTIKKLTPKKGPTSGGTTVAITGVNFTSSATVSFGGTAAGEVTFVSPTSITAVSPAAGAAGVVDVTVTTAAGTSALIKKDHFKYKASRVKGP
jgi:hypothetical protein